MRNRIKSRFGSWQARLGAMGVALLVALLAAALANAGAAAPAALAAKPPAPTPTATATKPPAPTPTPGCATSFVLASHPDRGGHYFDQLLGVAAVSASDVWAVGADDA